MASYFLMFTALLPIELPISLTANKIFYSFFIYNDIQLMCEKQSIEEGNIARCSINNINLLEDLGRVNHIFCDKTGTLTKNNLIFRSLAFDNQLFEKKGEDNFDQMSEKIM